MQRMTYWLQRTNALASEISKPLKTSQTIKSFKRFFPDKSIQKLDVNQVPTHKRFAKTKILVQISSIALLSLPAKSITTIGSSANNATAYDNVMSSNTLTLASVKGESTFFSTDGFQHGFGYDLSRSFANQLGVDVVVINYANNSEALDAVHSGQADMALTTASTLETDNAGVATINVSCGFDKSISENGLHPKTNWSFKNSNELLAIKASHFLCDNKQLVNTTKIANFYDQNLLKDDYNRMRFEAALNNKLPNYQSSFKQQAENYDHDWQLLVAMGYQESHLNADAISPTGVKGLMMLTSSTAKAMGVSDRVDPFESIGGGARYLEKMKDTFKHVPNPDRIWFALASYNMGPNAIKRIQRDLENNGLNPNSWSNVYAYMSDNAASNSRYVQCMHYVTNIRSYLESLKTQTT